MHEWLATRLTFQIQSATGQTEHQALTALRRLKPDQVAALTAILTPLLADTIVAVNVHRVDTFFM